MGWSHLARALGAILLMGAIAEAQSPNILLIVADDLGVDKVGAYDEHPDPGRTPVIDFLAARGMLFRNVWSQPTCSPTRATILTGRYGFRTGIGNFLGYLNAEDELSLDEVTLPDLLRPRYRAAAVGKWHLAGQLGTDLMHPQLSGFQHYRGSISNLPNSDGPSAYFDWEKTVGGVLTQSTTYATTDTVNDAIELVHEFHDADPEPIPYHELQDLVQSLGTGAVPPLNPMAMDMLSETPVEDVADFVESQDRPWFMWVAFNAPHKPFHKPPKELTSYDLSDNHGITPPLLHKAMTEAMDREIGRLLASLPPGVLANTYVIVAGDNGTHQDATEPPFVKFHSKATLYEGGINVPLIISGPGVQWAECRGLVNTTDLFATIAELAGAPAPTGTDAVSLVPYFDDPSQTSLRPWVFAELFSPNEPGPQHDPSREHLRTIRDARFKLIEYDPPGAPTFREFFDLKDDPWELTNLLGPGQSLTVVQQQRLDGLKDELETLLETGPGLDTLRADGEILSQG